MIGTADTSVSSISGARMRLLTLLTSTMLVVVGIIHLLPVSGVLGSDRLTTLYGLTFDEPNLAILMRHRAVLFGVLGVFMLVAAIKPSFQTAAFVAGFVSVASFLLIAYSIGGYNAAIQRVVIADWVALVCLAIGFAAHLRSTLQSAAH
jgi:hypothetical protein